MTDREQGTTGAGAANGAHPRVIVADDEPRIGQLIQRVCESMLGYPCDIAPTVQDALRRIEAGKADYRALLADIRIPVGGARWLLQELEARDHPIVERTIFLAGYPLDLAEDPYLRGLGRPLLPKPFSLQELLAALRGLGLAPQVPSAIPRTAPAP